MLSLIIIYFATAALSAPVVAPVSQQQASLLSSSSSTTDKISVPAKQNPAYEAHGPTDILRMYKRWGIDIPEGLEEHVTQHHQKRQASKGTVAATPNGNDLQYLCPVTVGGQTLNINFDTGSSDFWVFSSKQPSSQTTGHSIYNPDQSTTSQNVDGSTWSVGYGDGSSASGTVVSDSVTIGGVTVTSQAVEVATAVSTQFTQNTNVDGILGLAFSTLNSVQPDYVDTWFDNASPNLAQKLFTVDLRKGATGSYNFGYIDTTAYKGSVSYTSVDSSRGYWGFPAKAGYYVGTKLMADPIGAPNGAMVDTGSTFILMHDTIVKNYYAKVKGAKYQPNYGGWTFPCKSTLPTLKVAVGNSFSTVGANVLNYSKVSTTVCFGGLQGLKGQSASLPYIYGDVWHKSNFAVYDMGNMRIGFASK